MRYHFDEWVLDTDAIRIEVDDRFVAVEPQVFDVLRLLIEERTRVVSKQELLDRVWGHTFVTESALTSRIKSARQAIGDNGREQRLIRTVHGRGYQFVGQVHEDDDRGRRLDDEDVDGVEPGGAPRPRTGKPLPAYGSELIGRHDELRELDELLDAARLVTIVGPGGVGKTRLAIEWARRSARSTAFVDLTTVREPSLVLAHIAASTGLRDAGSDTVGAIGEHLAGRRSLIVVDNVEHVVDAAPGIGELVRRIDDLTVLATSRELLRVDGERVLVLDPLGVAAPEADPRLEPEAVELFVRTARAIGATLDVGRHRRAIERICEAVQGLPLAIELVAGQTRALPPDALADRLTERLRSASSTRRDLPERHRTMDATIDWSLRLLDVEELTLFQRLGAFVADADLDLVEAVCSDALLPDPVDALGRLVDKSLVRARAGEDGATHYGMLELLRARAAELLASCGDAGSTYRRHAEAVAERADEVDLARWGARVATWTDELSRLLPECRPAFAWAARHDDWELAGRLAASYGPFWHREGGLPEGRQLAHVVTAHLDEMTDATAARVLASSALLAWDDGDVALARSQWMRAAELLEATGDPARLAYVLAFTAVTALSEPDRHAWAWEQLGRAVASARLAGPPAALCEVLNLRGEFARGVGELAIARQSYTEARMLAAKIGDGSMERVALANLAYVECHEGKPLEGRRIGRIALRACADHDRRLMAAWSVGELAIPACHLGEYELAARLFGAALRAIEFLGGGRYPADVAEDEWLVGELINHLGREDYDRLAAEGAALTLDEAIALALGEDGAPAPAT